jgi:hypothetical protein
MRRKRTDGTEEVLIARSAKRFPVRAADVDGALGAGADSAPGITIY